MSSLKVNLLAKGFKEYQYGELIGTCPSCGKTDHFGVNYLKMIGHCYRCDYKLSAKNILRELGIVDGESFDFKPLPKFKTELKLDIPFIGDLGDRNYAAKRARRYLLDRGFTMDYAKMMGIGYGVDEYQDRVIIPFQENGSIVYFQARAIVPAKLKIKNPPKTGTIGKSLFLYNIGNARNYSSIVLCEGWADALSVGMNAMSMQGKKLSKMQKLKLLSLGVEEVIIVLDSQATESAYELAKELYKSIPSVKVAHLPNTDDGEENDPNSVEFSILQKELSRAETFTFATSLKIKLEL